MVKIREVIIFTGDVAFSRDAISTAMHLGEGLQPWCAAQESRNLTLTPEQAEPGGGVSCTSKASSCTEGCGDMKKSPGPDRKTRTCKDSIATSQQDYFELDKLIPRFAWG